ncbi:hypothetical protein GZ77_00695 [Endozoicomonas montiporae]|uniref:OTU domain-containing protein n=2 Tax=Endozoicomonas montiporae TaxID=1027273 RepID=A0A081N9W6_9GAMM|nr:hypothetical protein GZ77_00695 [Endozoicomonas montiporae]
MWAYHLLILSWERRTQYNSGVALTLPVLNEKKSDELTLANPNFAIYLEVLIQLYDFLNTHNRHRNRTNEDDFLLVVQPNLFDVLNFVTLMPWLTEDVDHLELLTMRMLLWDIRLQQETDNYDRRKEIYSMLLQLRLAGRCPDQLLSDARTLRLRGLVDPEDEQLNQLHDKLVAATKESQSDLEKKLKMLFKRYKGSEIVDADMFVSLGDMLDIIDHESWQREEEFDAAEKEKLRKQQLTRSEELAKQNAAELLNQVEKEKLARRRQKHQKQLLKQLQVKGKVQARAGAVDSDKDAQAAQPSQSAEATPDPRDEKYRQAITALLKKNYSETRQKAEELLQLNQSSLQRAWAELLMAESWISEHANLINMINYWYERLDQHHQQLENWLNSDTSGEDFPILARTVKNRLTPLGFKIPQAQAITDSPEYFQALEHFDNVLDILIEEYSRTETDELNTLLDMLNDNYVEIDDLPEKVGRLKRQLMNISEHRRQHIRSLGRQGGSGESIESIVYKQLKALTEPALMPSDESKQKRREQISQLTVAYQPDAAMAQNMSGLSVEAPVQPTVQLIPTGELPGQLQYGPVMPEQQAIPPMQAAGQPPVGNPQHSFITGNSSLPMLPQPRVHMAQQGMQTGYYVSNVMPQTHPAPPVIKPAVNTAVNGAVPVFPAVPLQTVRVLTPAEIAAHRFMANYQRINSPGDNFCLFHALANWFQANPTANVWNFSTNGHELFEQIKQLVKERLRFHPDNMAMQNLQQLLGQPQGPEMWAGTDDLVPGVLVELLNLPVLIFANNFLQPELHGQQNNVQAQLHTVEGTIEYVALENLEQAIFNIQQLHQQLIILQHEHHVVTLHNGQSLIQQGVDHWNLMLPNHQNPFGAAPPPDCQTCTIPSTSM